MPILTQWRSRIGATLKLWCAEHDLLLVPYGTAERSARLQSFNRVRSGRPLLLNPGEACQLISALDATRRLPGDIAEVGVAYGASARLLAEHAGGRTVHLFDTFEGLPLPDASDSAKFQRGDFRCDLENVRQYLHGLPVTFHKGLFPASADAVRDTRFSFVHLDVDLYQSTLDSLGFFYPRMSPGAILISHDYLSATGVDQAFAEFFADKPECVIELLGYQAMVVKLA